MFLTPKSSNEGIKRNSKNLSFFFPACLLFTFAFNLAAKDIEVTVYADDNYPPYSFQQNGEAQGIYTQILKQAFAKMTDYNINIKPVPWKRGLKLIETGIGFALYPPYHRTKERPYMWPYSIPILDERVVLFCREEILQNTKRPQWPDDYYGLIIGNNAGFALGGDKFWQAVKEGKIKVSEAKGNQENLLMLGLRRIDCYMNDRLSILLELKRLKESGQYDEGGKHAKLIEGITISIEQGFLALTDRDHSKYDYKEDFLKKFNTIIYDMRRTGELQEIVEQFIK
jgi:polar amino acid transport system substrate-binding protein